MSAFRFMLAGAALLPLTAHALTPEQLISAHRFSTAVPNPTGEWAIFTTTNYSIESNAAHTSWNLMNVSSGSIKALPFSSDVSEMIWVGDSPTSVLYINGTNDDIPGGVTLYTADLVASQIVPKQAASLNAAFSGLKAVRTKSGDINWIANSLAYVTNGSAYNKETASKTFTSGRLYGSPFVRHWDAYVTQERYALFSGKLTVSKARRSNSTVASYALDGQVKNLLQGIDAKVTRPETPVGPFGDSGDYDLSPDGSQVVLLTKAPELPKFNYTASYIYVVPHNGSKVAKKINGPDSKAPQEARGASGGPVWSPDSRKIAYFQQDGVAYESDRVKLYVADLIDDSIVPLLPDFDFNVVSVKWDMTGQNLWTVFDYIGTTRLFTIPVTASSSFRPTSLTDITSVSDYYVLPSGKFLVTSSAIWSPFNVYTIGDNSTAQYIYKANEDLPEFAGLGPDDVDFFWYSGTLGDKQQAMIVKPQEFDASRTYGLVFYIHGGPQDHTGNVWSNRWNLKAWADQGFVVVAPNPTGSTSYGQNLTDRVKGRWGSWPYEDLVNAFRYTCDNLKYIDCSNAVAAGASYGGYMTNWIQGHDLGREFKALITHDGITTTYANYGTDELWFIQHDFDGTLWQDRNDFAAWDPLSHASNFSTPHLVIHSDHDYRLPITEGIALFNVLQERGIPSRFLNFPDESHWVQQRANSLFWHRQIFNWINYWTGKTPSLDDIVITQ